MAAFWCDMNYMSYRYMNKFWSRIDKRGKDECWEWIGGRNSDGYGSARIDGKTVGAHRASYQIFVSPIPPGMSVLHRCDNPPCVNPAHLFLGTQADNIRDREQKGRGNQNKGEKHIRAKLKESDIPVIRNRHCSGETIASLSREYGVSESGIRFLVNRKSWRHVL